MEENRVRSLLGPAFGLAAALLVAAGALRAGGEVARASGPPAAGAVRDVAGADVGSWLGAAAPDAGDFELTVTPASREAAPGTNPAFTVRLVPGAGFDAMVPLEVEGLPEGATRNFSRQTIGPPTFQVVLIVRLKPSTPSGTYTLTVRGESGGVARAATMALVVVAPTPTATPPPTPTPGPLEHHAYLPYASQDVFRPVKDDFSDPASGWPEGESADSIVGYVDGEYRVVNKAAGVDTLVLGGHVAEDVDLTVSARRVGDVQGYYGLAFGVDVDFDDPTSPVSGYVAYVIQPATREWLLYRCAPVCESLATGKSFLMRMGTVANKLRLRRQGGQLTVWLNNGQLHTGAYTTPGGKRHVALVAGAFDAGHEVRFDNYDFKKP